MICLVIVCSVKILEFTVIKYFQKLIIRVQILEGLYKVMFVGIRSFYIYIKKCYNIKNVSVISIISYRFNTLFKVKECGRVSTSELLDSLSDFVCLLFFPVLVMY